MTFDELRLCMAIHLSDIGKGDRPTHEQRKDAAISIFCAWLDVHHDTRFPFSMDDVTRMALLYRKRPEMQVKIDVALLHGHRCFFNGRGKGPCSDEAELGHLVPRCKGGPLDVRNCQIECRAHNNQRRERTIEEYLMSSETTDACNEGQPSACVLAHQNHSDASK